MQTERFRAVISGSLLKCRGRLKTGVDMWDFDEYEVCDDFEEQWRADYRAFGECPPIRRDRNSVFGPLIAMLDCLQAKALLVVVEEVRQVNRQKNRRTGG